jgi:hypothetical protein
VKEVIRSETELAFAAIRTQLFNAADLDNVKKVQAGYASGFTAFRLERSAPAFPGEMCCIITYLLTCI